MESQAHLEWRPPGLGAFEKALQSRAFKRISLPKSQEAQEGCGLCLDSALSLWKGVGCLAGGTVAPSPGAWEMFLDTGGVGGGSERGVSNSCSATQLQSDINRWG